MHGFSGLVKAFGFYPERLESWGSQQMAGWHGLLCISESPLTSRGWRPGLGREEQTWKKGREALEEPRNKKRVTKTRRVDVGRRRRKKKSTTLFD